jgi:hypothetical protein
MIDVWLNVVPSCRRRQKRLNPKDSRSRWVPCRDLLYVPTVPAAGQQYIKGEPLLLRIIPNCWFAMYYRRLFLELLVQSLPSKNKVSSKDIFSWFGISIKPGNSVLALIFQCISFRLIIRPKLDLMIVKSVGDILFNLDHHLEILFRIELDFFGLSMMASYDLLNLPNFPLNSFRHPAACRWLLSPKKWKIKGPASLQWDCKKGMRLCREVTE